MNIENNEIQDFVDSPELQEIEIRRSFNEHSLWVWADRMILSGNADDIIFWW